MSDDADATVELGWNQPVCNPCWRARYGGTPSRLVDPEVEVCCFCGAATGSGIFVRIDPTTVAHARPRDRES